MEEQKLLQSGEQEDELEPQPNYNLSQNQSLTDENFRQSNQNANSEDELEGGDIVYRRRKALPYEIVVCHLGRTPLGQAPYKKFCQGSNCKMGTLVAKNGANYIQKVKGRRPDYLKPKNMLINMIDKQKVRMKNGRLPKQEFDAWGPDRRCVQGYPQIEFDPDKPRLAYWECNREIKLCCKVYFKGCGKQLCDLHAIKRDEFKAGRRIGEQKKQGCCGMIQKWEIIDVHCYECKPFINIAELERYRDIRKIWVIILLIIAVILIAGIIIIELMVHHPELFEWTKPAPAGGGDGEPHEEKIHI